ncbi:MAG: hypothetical protein AAFW98_04780, partial [Pseudomonadota bacterium]
ETWSYIDFHVTNYTLGAIEMLDPARAPVLTFAERWLDAAHLDDWLDRRDWHDPWQEGNNLVNLASFLVLLLHFGAPAPRERADRVLRHLLERLEREQNPATGFWGNGQEAGGDALLHAMAGAMHIFHLWYLIDRPLPHQHEAVRYALTLPARDIISACLDVDAVDLLYHGAQSVADDRPAIDAFMRDKLAALLDAQNQDGGFPDQHAGTLRFDGWVHGYSEPQGGSNTFATWFRWIAIALIAEHLWPGWHPWTFRRMIGIGYARTTALAHG